MNIIKAQLNHPGHQKKFSKNENGFFRVDSKIFREWNAEDSHYRKFMKSKGSYIESKSVKDVKSDELFFWGEWEGYSEFTNFPINNKPLLPNGLHVPICLHEFKNEKIFKQNTDPYIFGERFKYATCKQTGQMCKMEEGSLILFGSTYPKEKLFVIDTVFVVGKNETSTSIIENKAKNYTQVYKKMTLEPLEDLYINNKVKNSKRLYQSQTWWDNNEYFSFVPCKLNHEGNGFERLTIDLDKFSQVKFSSNATGKSYLRETDLTPLEVWKIIHDKAICQKFLLGVSFDEPQINIINSQNNSNNLINLKSTQTRKKC